MASSVKILSQGKISSSILYHNDDILAVGLSKGCPEFLVSLGHWFPCALGCCSILCIGYEWKNALLLSSRFVKATLSPAFPFLQVSELCQPEDVQHRAVCQYSSVPPQGTLDTNSCTSTQQIITTLYTGWGVQTSDLSFCKACCEDSRNKAMAGGVFSKWSCQVLEKRSQRQTSLIPTGEDSLSRNDWQNTRFGETPFLWHGHCHTLTPPSPHRGFTGTSAQFGSFSHSCNSTYKQSALKEISPTNNRVCWKIRRDGFLGSGEQLRSDILMILGCDFSVQRNSLP